MVRYVDEKYDLVEDYCVDYLIVTGRIIGHSIDGGWKKVLSCAESIQLKSAPCEIQKQKRFRLV